MKHMHEETPLGITAESETSMSYKGAFPPAPSTLYQGAKLNVTPSGGGWAEGRATPVHGGAEVHNGVQSTSYRLCMRPVAAQLAPPEPSRMMR